MSTVIVKVGTKGRVTLPKALRDALKVAPGDQISFSQLSDGSVIIRAKHRRLSTLAGMLTRPDQPNVSIEEMRL
jgi:AbrB family looped-hinge helix DNA binding protein